MADSSVAATIASERLAIVAPLVLKNNGNDFSPERIVASNDWPLGELCTLLIMIGIHFHPDEKLF
jgi:hypothetical protein